MSWHSRSARWPDRCCSAACHLFVPERSAGGDGAHVPAHGGSWAGLKYLVTHRYLLVIVVGLMLFHLYDLRKVLSAFFAKGLLRQASSAGQVGATFALGGVVGALLYAVSRHRGRGAGWVLGGVAGTVLLALGWIPVNLPTMIVAVFLFGVTNVGARLVLTRWRQELTPWTTPAGWRPPPSSAGPPCRSVSTALWAGRFGGIRRLRRLRDRRRHAGALRRRPTGDHAIPGQDSDAVAPEP